MGEGSRPRNSKNGLKRKTRANDASTNDLFSLQDLKGLEIDPEHFEDAMADQYAAGSSNKSKEQSLAQDEMIGENFIALAPSSGEEDELPPVQESRLASKKRRRSRSHSPSPSSTHHEKHFPWCKGLRLSRCRNVAELLHMEVEAFTKYMSPTPHEDTIRSLVVSLVESAILHSFPDAQVVPFGSFSTKLYLPSGDIDLVVLSERMRVSNKHDVLQRMAHAMKSFGITHKVQIVAKARVPIIKFVTTTELGRFKIDISMNQYQGLEGLKVISAFLALHDTGIGMALKALVLVTKQFLSQRSMNEVYTGGLGSYSIVCLAISFLQMHPKIRNGHIDPSKNLGVLLIEFFELYGVYFNYEQVGLSIRDGGSYYSKQGRGWYDHYNSRRLSIEDPVDETNDISSGSYAFAKVRTTLAGAHGLLTTNSFLKAGILGSSRRGSYVQLRTDSRGEPQNEEMSILSSIVSISQDVINHRRLVEELWHRGTVHEQCGLELPAAEPEEVPPPLPSSSSRHHRQTTEEKRRSSEKKAKQKEKRQRQKEAQKQRKNPQREQQQQERRGRQTIEYIGNGETRIVHDLVTDSDSEGVDGPPRPTKAEGKVVVVLDEEEEEEEGKYEIGSRAKKRRRTDEFKPKPDHDTGGIIFVPVLSSSSSSSSVAASEAGDSDTGLVLNIIDNGRKDLGVSDAEDGELVEEDRDRERTKTERRERRRDYWLSKATADDEEYSD